MRRKERGQGRSAAFFGMFGKTGALGDPRGGQRVTTIATLGATGLSTTASKVELRESAGALLRTVRSSTLELFRSPGIDAWEFDVPTSSSSARLSGPNRTLTSFRPEGRLQRFHLGLYSQA